MNLNSILKKIIIEDVEKQKVLTFSSLDFFGDDTLDSWNILQKILKRKGNPPYSIDGDLDLFALRINSLGNLVSVGGYLNLAETDIESLGYHLISVGGNLNLISTPIESLGNLQSVGGYLDLKRTPIKSLGNLVSVGGNLNLISTPLSKMYTEKQIRKMVNVGGEINF